MKAGMAGFVLLLVTLWTKEQSVLSGKSLVIRAQIHVSEGAGSAWGR
jgi:hypothetical protein